MTVAPGDVRSRVQHLLELDGTVLTEVELTRLAVHYPRCAGKDHWGVREYAEYGHPGGREYRVVRGTGIQDVFASDALTSATAVRTALNEMETEGG